MLKEDEKSKHTIEKYMRDVRCFQCFAKERGIDKALTIEYKAFLEKEYATVSANSMIAALNSFLRFNGWDECCIKQFKVQKKTYCSENDELTKAEYLSLVRAAESEQNERLSLLIQTICGTILCFFKPFRYGKNAISCSRVLLFPRVPSLKVVKHVVIKSAPDLMWSNIKGADNFL